MTLTVNLSRLAFETETDFGLLTSYAMGLRRAAEREIARRLDARGALVLLEYWQDPISRWGTLTATLCYPI